MKPIKIIEDYKYFESQETDEKVVFVIRHHWTILIVPFIVGSVVLGLTGIIVLILSSFGNITLSESGETIATCVVSLIFLFTILYVFLSWLIRYLNVIILTGEHLVEIQQLGVFSRKISELDLDCIEDASSAQKGFIQTMFQFGDVLIQTAGELPNFNLVGIENPNGIQQKIMETKEQYMKCNLYNHGDNSAPVQETTEKPNDQDLNIISPEIPKTGS
jgi:uncharacterized membrane protein YdbT with pleckstrin-like domain